MGPEKERPVTYVAAMPPIFCIWDHDLSRFWASFSVDLPRGRFTLNGFQKKATSGPMLWQCWSIFRIWGPWFVKILDQLQCGPPTREVHNKRVPKKATGKPMLCQCCSIFRIWGSWFVNILIQLQCGPPAREVHTKLVPKKTTSGPMLWQCWSISHIQVP